MASALRADIASAAALMSSRMGVKAEIQQLVDQLLPGENVQRLALAMQRTAAGRGLLVLTDRRLLYLREKRIGLALQEVLFQSITSAGWSSGFSSGTVTVSATGTKHEFTVVPTADGEPLVRDLRESISGGGMSSPGGHTAEFGVPEPDAPPQQPADAGLRTPGDPAAFPMIVEQLRQLAELRDNGVITAADFEAKKQELLARI